VLHVYNAPRSGGGSLHATERSIAELRGRGIEVFEFRRDSSLIEPSLSAALRTSKTALMGGDAPRAFRQALSRLEPDLVHINELFPLITPRILPLCREANIPVVMSVDDYHLTCPVRTHLRRGRVCTECLGGREWNAVRHNCKGSLTESVVAAAYNLGFRRRGDYTRHVSHYVAPSEFTRRWLVERFGVAEADTSAIPLPVDIPPSGADPGAGSYVAFAGRVVPEKGVDVFLKAVERAGVPVRFARASHFFQTVPIPDWAEIVIPKDRDELAAYYRGARLLVMPSLWFETFGLVGAEAMSHGVPIIVSRIGAVGELVDEGTNGLAFAPGDADDLAGRITELWNDPSRCRALGTAARAKAIERWSTERHGSLMVRLYEQVLASGS